jgi:hypothetical protein
VLPTTFTFEVGKEADHQVRESARSGLRSFELDARGLNETDRATYPEPIDI